MRLSQAAGPILIATLWQGLALTALAAFCLRLAPRTTATLRFALWSSTLLLICLLPLGVMGHRAHAVVHADPSWSFALGSLWLFGSLVRAADLARHAFRLRSLSRRATPVSAGGELARLLQTGRRPQLCTSTQLDRPGVIGFFRPRILIPVWLFAQLTAPELEQIVLHELEHLRRGDDWLNLLQKFALVIFPLNPALRWIERRLCLERELACDEGVVRRTRAPRLYATCLVRLAEHGLDHRALLLAVGFLERRSELARRVSGILHAPRTLTSRQSVIITGSMAALLLTGSVELSRCPQLISFAASPVALSATMAAPRLAPEMWAESTVARPVVYTDAAAAHLLRATWKHAHKPIHRVKVHRVHPAVPIERASREVAGPVELLATDSIHMQPAVPLATPTLVRYTLVHVEGGWLLVQL